MNFKNINVRVRPIGTVHINKTIKLTQKKSCTREPMSILTLKQL